MFDPRIDAQGAQSLADLMGGGSAAQYLGGQQAMIEQMNPINRDISLADLDRLSLANDHNRVMNPMLQQVQRAEVRNADSKTPEYFTGMRAGELGTARSNVAKAKLDEGTLEGNINAKNSSNQTQMIQDMGKNMLNVAAYIGSNVSDPTEQKAALAQLISHHGWDKNPATKAIWENLLNSPNMLQEASGLAKRLMEFNPDHLSKMAVGKQTADSNELIHERSDKRALEVARIQANAQMEAARLRQKNFGEEQLMFKLEEALGKGNYAAGERLAQMLEAQGDLATAKHYREIANSIKIQQINKAKAGAQVPDATRRALIGMPPNSDVPNGNGTGGAVDTPKTYDPVTKTWK